MALIEALLRRLGYVKLERYGLALAPTGEVVSLAGPGIPVATAPFPLPNPSAAPTPTPRFSAPTAPDFSSAPPPRAPSEPAEDAEDDEWEWRRALARAKANSEPTQIVPKPRQANAIRTPARPASRALPGVGQLPPMPRSPPPIPREARRPRPSGPAPLRRPPRHRTARPGTCS